MSRRTLAQRYWDAYAAGLEPPPGSASRTLARIQQRIRAGEVVDDTQPAAVEPPRQAAAGLVVLFGKSAAVSVGIATAALLSIKLAAVGWSQLAGGAPASVERSAAAERARPSAPSRAEAMPVAEPVSPGEVQAAPTSDVAPAPSGEVQAEPSRRSRSAPAIADRLRAEVALMDRARAALEHDDAEALFRLTREHGRRFPDGALVEERQAWQAIAACRLGHADAATRADAFLRAHARSAQADKLRRACASAIAIDER